MFNSNADAARTRKRIVYLVMYGDVARSRELATLEGIGSTKRARFHFRIKNRKDTYVSGRSLVDRDTARL